MWPWGACWLRKPGERQAGRPRRSDGSGLGVAFACTVGALRIDVAWGLRGWGVPRRFCRVLRVLKVLGILGVLGV